jgi:hypothetical protein
MKAGRINRIRMALLFAGILFCSLPARAGRYDYTGSWILKLNTLAVTESDIGFGIGGEYRFQDILAFQLEAGYAGYGQEDLSIQSLNALSFRPEFRVYLPHPGRRNASHVDPYAGLEFTLRYSKTHFAAWRNFEDDLGNSYQRYSDYKTKNFTFGPVFRFGLQMYFGSARKLVADAGFGIGPTFNQVSREGDAPVDRSKGSFNIDPFSFNKYSGIYAHAQLDLRIGYRF